MIAFLKSGGHTRNLLVVALILCGALLVQCTLPSKGPEVTGELMKGPEPGTAYANVTPPLFQDVVSPEDQIRQQLTAGGEQTLEALKAMLDRYDRTIHDYSCTFIKKERVNGQLRNEQIMSAEFMEEPFSVHLKWDELGDSMAQQAIFVDGKITDDNGNKMAWAQPKSPLNLIVNRVEQDIWGANAKRASRKPISNFGVANSLRLIIKYCDIAYADGDLDLRYVGEGTIKGRKTFVIERRLPFDGNEDGKYPDAYLIVHIDEENLIPAAAVAYNKDQVSEETLLGSYVWTDFKPNLGLTEDLFTPEANNF